MAKRDLTLTSGKVESDLFDEFKVECIKRKVSFQQPADRAIRGYLTEEEFRKDIHNHNSLDL